MHKVTSQAVIVKKVLKKSRFKPLVKEVQKRLERLDEKKFEVEDKLAKRKEAAPKTLAEKAVEEKTGVERRLEDSDEALSQLIQFGNELVTNVKVANEKREILRRNFEAVKREELLSDLEKESIEALARFEEITTKWTELRNIKEPMGLFEELEIQKNRISDLMKQKDDIIKQCQAEIHRVDEHYYFDQQRQTSDIYCLVERVDNQIDLIKNTYNQHLELLQNTIEDERKILATKASQRWQELYDKQAQNENTKYSIQKEKSKFYNDEISRITREQEEITRATRIRLERDAEVLQLELRSIKNNVIMNSEKLDYNYQVLQKRNEENVVVGNQQKRRVAKINETIAMLRKKIRETKTNSELTIKTMTREIVQLHSSITDLETKSEQFRIHNQKKYNTIWDINYKEAVDLTNKVLDIDKILYEQQLGLEWHRPNVPFLKKSDLPSFKELTRQTVDFTLQPTKLPEIGYLSLYPSSAAHQDESKTDEQKLAEHNLLRNILIKIADRAGFLVEDRLLQILEPYSDEEKALVRIDNIFNALQITNIEDVKSLTQYFLPYAWCPNCTDGLEILGLYEESEDGSKSQDKKMEGYAVSRISIAHQSILSSLELQEAGTSRSDTSTIISYQPDELDLNVDRLVTKHETSDMTTAVPEVAGKMIQLEKSSIRTAKSQPECKNHYLIIEPTLVLTALREFTEKHLNKNHNLAVQQKRSISKRPDSGPKIIAKDDVIKFWSQFKVAMPEEKQKLWKCMEHGLNHYLVVLKERESLDKQCEFLRRQNAELKHLLQRYLPEN